MYWRMNLRSILFLACFSIINCDVLDEAKEFNKMLQTEKFFAVFFTQECCTCTECVEAEALLVAMNKHLEDTMNLLIVRLKNPDLRKLYGVKSVPSFVLIREGKPALYDGEFELEAVLHWIGENREPLTKDLDDVTFEHLTQAATGATTGDWLVAFYDNTCIKNYELLTHMEGAGTRLRNKANVALVNKDKAPELVDRFKIKGCPEILFFRLGKMYRFTFSDITVTTLRRFAEGWYKNSKAESVPLPATAFDKLTEEIADFLKRHKVQTLTIVSVATILIFILSFLFYKKHPIREKSE